METKLLTDEQIDRALRTLIPGGSVARDWFLPHDTIKGAANIRDVVRRIVEALPVSAESVARIEALEAGLRDLLSAQDAEAKAELAVEVALDNFSCTEPEMKTYERAMIASSWVETCARKLLEDS